METALYWERGEAGAVHCLLCPHRCIVPPGGKGRCLVRSNVNGTLYAMNYAQICGLALDPVEKKPLYHFFPGSKILSVGLRGCNLACGFCQNWASVRGEHGFQVLSPDALVALALSVRERGNCGLAFTYTEPLMAYEYVVAAAELARRNNLKTVLVCNGFSQPQPWRRLLECVDAVNIDLKAFNPRFYRVNCGGSIEPVLEAITIAASSCHLEVTTLLIPGQNTQVEEIKSLASFLANLSPQIPLHLSRYYPARHWRQPPTPSALISELAAVAREQLDFVYTGNLADSYTATTNCPVCGQILIQRGDVTRLLAVKGSCPRCGYTINIPTREEKTCE